MKRRLLILAAVTAAEAVAVVACFIWADRQIALAAGEMEEYNP